MDGLIPTERSGSGDEIRVEFHERVGPFRQSIPGVPGKLAPAGEPAKEFTPRGPGHRRQLRPVALESLPRRPRF